MTKSSEFSPAIRTRSPGSSPELARLDAVLEVRSRKLPRSISRPLKEKSFLSGSISKVFTQDPTRVSSSGIRNLCPDITS